MDKRSNQMGIRELLRIMCSKNYGNISNEREVCSGKEKNSKGTEGRCMK